MKRGIIALIALAAIPASADTAGKSYQVGMAAVRDGDVKTAEAAFREALRLSPGFAHARYQLGELRLHRATIAARARAKQLTEYKIEGTDFRDVELSDALAVVSMQVEEQSEKKFSPNFIIRDPSNQLADTRVTLQVKNLAANNVLDMLAAQGGASVTYEEHAIILKPLPKAGK